MSSSSMMSFLSMVEAELPPGFRFHPRDDELVCDYLAPKLTTGFSARRHQPPMVDVDLNKVEPWDLPAAASVGPREWYFFSLKDRKYATGQRTNRATASGYWKATGKDRPVARRGALVGMRKTLVFYQGRAPKGRKTEWVMHEYRTIDGHLLQSSSPSPNNKLSSASNKQQEEDWVLCRVICKKKSAGGGGAASSKPAAARSGRLVTNNGRHGTTGIATNSSLPPLMDTTLAQLQAAAMTNATTAGAAIGQVPCFSSFNNNSTATTTNSSSIGIIGNAAQQQQQQPCYLLQLPSTVTAAAGSNSATMSYQLDHGGSSGQLLPELVGTCCGGYDPLNSDKKLLKAVLSQLGGDVVAPSSMSSSSSPDVAAASAAWMNHYF